MKVVWYIILKNLDKPNYTAHLDPNCGQLIKPNSPRCRLPKLVRIRHELGVHAPCKMCGGKFRKEWEDARNKRIYGLK